MYVAETRVDTAGRATLEVRKLRGPLDLFAWIVAEDGCRHGADGQGFCWINPPRWMWWLGAPVRTWSLGGVIFEIGQWAHRRTGAPAVVWSHPVAQATLEEAFEWPRD
jgi:hypothetical protein